ncbi:sporulation membrane protein YtaF [Lentibacillus cibarius]|uniref:Sporulation membrane protein YtaF n=2 Tax=Lentibacillus cibarius TaxID=2583219 RepID=A0A549YMN7_9BACI|nr:sporulation membrane protein YtaF [Lentibacillus cibarius]TMN23788.1 sporulation membrane protein YtaF [Lentibacillus cibarius]TRM13142.1 sporulation membrane protein YtaF [Lentibacillus cibarius]
MFYYTRLILLVIGVSIDGFGAGMSYGMRKVHIPYTALVIIMLCSGFVVYLSMTIGTLLMTFIPAGLTDKIGGIILFGIGLYCLFNVLRNGYDTTADTTPDSETWNHVKTVIKEPRQADIDQSGNISTMEAVLLGFALAVDAFGAGLGAAMLGYAPLLTAASIALMSGLFLFCGVRMGVFLAAKKWTQKLTLLPPFLLMLLGIMNIL